MLFNFSMQLLQSIENLTLEFFAHENMKENSKVRHFSKIEEIYHYCPGCQNGPKRPKTAQTVKFMFSNVVYRPTVCKTRELRWCTA